MTEFNINRLTYNWKGEWTTGDNYNRDDVVSFNGKSYVCLATHTASTNFQDDLNFVVPASDPPIVEPKWVLMTAGITYRGSWSPATEYNKYELVYYKGTVYRCETAHISTVNFAENEDKWEFFALHIDYVGNWSAGENYSHGALAAYNGIIYKCIRAHIAQARLEDNASAWQVFYNGIKFRGIWAPDTEYRKNDLVKFGASIYRCNETHLSQPTQTIDQGQGEIETVLGFDTAKFDLEILGSQYDLEWNNATEFQIGDVVRYGGFLYYAVKQNIDTIPDDDIDTWKIISEAYRFTGVYDQNNSYNPGDVVQRGGNLYVAKRDILPEDGSTQDILDSDWWEIILPGSVFSNIWQTELYYSQGEIVYFNGTAYRCNEDHISDLTNFPGDNGNIFDYWDTFIQAGILGALNTRGDLLSFGLSRSVVGDGSTEGNIHIPIGATKQFLSVDEELEIFWRNVENNSQVIYVSPTGIDDEEFDLDRGLRLDKPFKTIKYACQYVEDEIDPDLLVTIKIATGEYEEIAPIIVPEKTALFGDELRSTTIRANTPIESYQNDFSLIEESFTVLTEFLADVLQNIAIEASDINPEQQKLSTTITNVTGVNLIISEFDVFKNYVNFRINDGDTDPVLTGSNTPNPDQTVVDAGQALWENRKFLANELWARLSKNYPDKNLDRIKYVNDFISIFRGIRKDLQFVSSNYYIILAGERYVNAVVGSQTKDLFYLRDTTGLRNCTLKGLEGDLIEPVPEQVYPQVSGGAYVSLDPGWGPDDDRTWITERSPYIQGVTTLGTGCVGKKLDASLHNGGNRSMVSNDFTQVLSDGIGIWTIGDSRTELVSVFTYYCAVGYLAQEGGTIRATNGNNSYGRFGTVADGNNPSETPQQVKVFNRNNEAQVSSAIAGNSNNEIIVFEYTNTGENYTEATASIFGAGDFAEVEFSDFRDNAVFDVRVLPESDSGALGGAAYTLDQGFCQDTSDASSTIRLKSSDSTQLDTDYIGQRLIIIAGPAAGQYGIIDAYDPPTKEARIRKESTGDLGWDHIIGGYPIASSLESTNQYRIEPRIDVDSPSFGQNYYNLPSDRTIIKSVYGNRTDIYPNIELPIGNADVDITAPATINVTKKGQQYDVELVDPGLGYVLGDSFAISGETFGETSPENDLFIDITEVTDDSSASIVSFDFEGTVSNKVIVGIANPNFAITSQDGEIWTENTLPFVGSYTSLAAGKNKFIAVADAEDRIAISLDGENWSESSIPMMQNWSDIAYGRDKFVIISSNTNFVLYSNDGSTWSVTEIPEDTVSDSTGDSTVSFYEFLEYGKGIFVALSRTDRATATSADGITWTRHDTVLPVINADDDYVGFTYGDNKFVYITGQGEIGYSFDGIEWFVGEKPVNDENADFVDIDYYQGLFSTIIITNSESIGPISFSGDLLNWQNFSLTNNLQWTSIIGANPKNQTSWYLFANETVTDGVGEVFYGKTAKFRPTVRQGQITEIKIWDPGSGYDSLNPPAVTLYDNSNTVDALLTPRIGNGSLAQPDFINRGSGYVAASSNIIISGNGYADIIPRDNIITLAGISSLPGLGAQIRFDGLFDELFPAQLKLFTAVAITDLGDDGTRNSTNLVRIQLDKTLETTDNIFTGTNVTIREEYSQARITNHDFLDIGTGNFEDTNYPAIYAEGAFFQASQENEVTELNGGKVFYVSTDQDGNFRGGELFAVDQGTGVITISAEFFDLQGLSELALGGIRLGGTGTVVREFSTDPNFTADSDNVIPTQRAIAAFLQDRLSVGGENLETNLINAGRISIGGPDNEIRNIAGNYIDIPDPVFIQGNDLSGSPTAISGTILGQQFILQSQDDTMQ